MKEFLKIWLLALGFIVGLVATVGGFSLCIAIVAKTNPIAAVLIWFLGVSLISAVGIYLSKQ